MSEVVDIPSFVIDQYDNPPLSVNEQKSLEDRETDAFLDSEYKKKISDEISTNHL